MGLFKGTLTVVTDKLLTIGFFNLISFKKINNHLFTNSYLYILIYYLAPLWIIFHLFRIKSAHFSPIIIHTALVLPDIKVGIIDASAILKFFIP